MQAPRRLQLRRGNTAAISTYVGAPGELIVNTTTNTLYLHDGVTVGGTATTVNTASITSNISSLQGNITTLTANAGVQASNIASLTSSITGANAAIVTANTNMKGYVDAANTIQTNQITTVSSSVTGANAAIITANTALKGYVDGQITTVSNSVAGANAAIVTANTSMKGYVDSVANNTSYSNSNVASYLPTYSGNIAGNIAKNGYTWTFGTDGNLTLPSDGYLRITSGITTTGASPAPIISGFTITNSQGISGNGNITTTQYVNAGYFTGNGALLTGIVAGAGTTYSNANVAAYLTNYDGDINFTSSVAIISNVDVITVLDSIRSPSYQYSNGVSILSGLGYGNTEVASYLPTYTGNIGNVKTTANVITSGYFVGNGALLTGIVAGTTYSNSNVASYLPTYSGNIANLTVTNTLTLTATKIALGYLSGLGGAGQGTNSVAVGSYSGYNTQGNSAVAIGVNAGMTQGDDTVAIGSNAGGSQTTQAVAVGFGAGQNTQSMGAVALGYASGQTAQGLRAVAIGSVAGNDHQGAQSIAIGHNSGYSYQPANSIELNATGSPLNYANLTAGLYITSVKNDTANVTNVMYYNTTSKEVTYGPASGGSNYSNTNVAAYLTTATITTTGNVTAGNLITGGALYVANITTTGASGNISGANYITANVILTNGGWGNISQVALITANVVTATSYIKVTPTTVANLISASTVGAGARDFVTDANTITFGSVVGGSGANNMPVFSNGTSWLIG